MQNKKEWDCYEDKKINVLKNIVLGVLGSIRMTRKYAACDKNDLVLVKKKNYQKHI